MVSKQYLLIKTTQAALTQWMTEWSCSDINVYYVGVFLFQLLPTQLIFHLHMSKQTQTQSL